MNKLIHILIKSLHKILSKRGEPHIFINYQKSNNKWDVNVTTSCIQSMQMLLQLSILIPNFIETIDDFNNSREIALIERQIKKIINE